MTTLDIGLSSVVMQLIQAAGRSSFATSLREAAGGVLGEDPNGITCRATELDSAEQSTAPIVVTVEVIGNHVPLTSSLHAAICKVVADFVGTRSNQLRNVVHQFAVVTTSDDYGRHHQLYEVSYFGRNDAGIKVVPVGDPEVGDEMSQFVRSDHRELTSLQFTPVS